MMIIIIVIVAVTHETHARDTCKETHAASPSIQAATLMLHEYR